MYQKNYFRGGYSRVVWVLKVKGVRFPSLNDQGSLAPDLAATTWADNVYAGAAGGRWYMENNELMRRNANDNGYWMLLSCGHMVDIPEFNDVPPEDAHLCSRCGTERQFHPKLQAVIYREIDKKYAD